MKVKILLALAGYCLYSPLQAQSDIYVYRNFPLVLTVQFHSLAVPFRNLKSNLSNVGFGLGTEVSFNGNQRAVQQLSALWYRNRKVGNGIMIYTQAVWRPAMVNNMFTELKTGLGYQYSFRPVKSFRQEDGKWMSVGRKGKGMLVLPAGFSVGNHVHSSTINYSPFVTYQMMLAKGYNASVPIIPETIIQAGISVQRNL